MFFSPHHISPTSQSSPRLNFLKNFLFFFFFLSYYKWILFLSPKPGLLPVRDTALGLCSMSVSSLSVRLWKPDNPLMESTSGYCCLYPPPSLQHIWRFIEGEGWAAGACTNMAGHDGNRKGGRKNRGRRETHQGVMGTPLTCLWRTQCSGRAGHDYPAVWAGQIMMGALLLRVFLSNKGRTSSTKESQRRGILKILKEIEKRKVTRKTEWSQCIY